MNLKTKLLTLAVILLLLSGCTLKKPSSTSCPRGTTWQDPPKCCMDGSGVCVGNSTATGLLLWEDWIPLAAILIIIGFILMGLAYMFAYAFGYKSLEIFVKNELFQLAGSAFIIGNVLFFSYLIDSYSQQFAIDILAMQGGSGSAVSVGTGEWEVNPGHALNVSTYNPNGRWATVTYSPGTRFKCPSPCHIYLARAYLGMAYERVYQLARSVVKAYATLSWIDYIRVGGWVNIFGALFQLGFTMMPFTGLSIIYYSLGTCFDFMAKAMVALKFQEMTLLYIQNGIYPLFLIAGIILRSVWFTRKLGGLLIAIAIGTYTLFPLLYVLCWYTIDSSTTVLDIQANTIVPDSFHASLLPWQANNLEIDDKKLENMLFTSYDANNIPKPGLLELTSGLLLPALAVPLLNLFVTIAFIKTLSASIGGDVEIAGLTRII